MLAIPVVSAASHGFSSPFRSMVGSLRLVFGFLRVFFSRAVVYESLEKYATH
jgi:hypothetical protein